MVLHIVLFRPKPTVTDSDRAAMFEALRVASTEIPAVQTFYVGERLTHGADYEALAAANFPYAAVVSFENLEALQSYLKHPKHGEVGRLFYELLEAGMVYDYEEISTSAR